MGKTENTLNGLYSCSHPHGDTTLRISLYGVLLFFTFLIPIGCTQEHTSPEYTTWGLPDGAKYRLGKGEIAAIQFSPDGSLLAIASSVGIWLYDAATGKELALLPRHRDGFNVSATSATGGAFIKNSLTFSPDNKLLASASEDDTIRVFDVTTYKVLRTLYKTEKIATNPRAGTPYKALAFSADGKTLTSLEGIGERRIKVWDVNSGRLLSNVSGRIGGPPLQFVMTLSPDGSTFAATKPEITVVNGIPDTEIRLGNVHTGELELPVLRIQSLTQNTNPIAPDSSFYPIRDLTFSPDGTTLASIEYRNTRDRNENSQRIRHTIVRFWYVSTGEEVATIMPKQGVVNPQSPVFAFSPDSRTFVTVDKGAPIQLWDVSTGKEISSITIPEQKQDKPWYEDVITSLAFHPNGKTLAIAIDETSINGRNFSLQLWDINREKIKTILTEHPMQYTFTANENNILCLNAGNFEIRGTAKGEKIRNVTEEWVNLVQHLSEIVPDAFAVSSDMSTCAIGLKDGMLELWTILKGERLQTLTGHTDIVKVVAFSKDGSRLASGSKDKSIRIWDVRTGAQLLSLTEHINSGKVQEFSNGQSQASAEVLENLVFSDDGNMLAGSSEYGTIWVWDLKSGKLLRTITTHEAVTDIVDVGFGPKKISLAFSPDGKHLASGNMTGGVILTDVHNSDLTQTLEPQSWRVLALAFSPDGKLLASGSKDTSINIYEVETGGKITTLRGHTTGVLTLTFSEDSKTLVSGSMDGAIIFWDRDKIVEVK
ncbi:hypothetical protein F4X73_10470 [Candidatus Poribacteria bacterium]|nr:hypothetical protein [Candidatus Poribacteria bacterium]MYB65104.1 hypothetical protein [Candidatus Poribacteria bacterium]MYF55495.1 hypothetical protein [Candidatus Poribacteria bacterium]